MGSDHGFQICPLLGGGPPGQFIGYPDRPSQHTDSCRRVTVRIPLHLTTLYHGFSTLFRKFNTGYQIVAIWELSSAIVVFWPQVLQLSLHSITVIGPVVIPFMQD